MGFRDRRYYREGSGGEDYLSSPASVLAMSVPFGTWFGVHVRLHFWMMLALLFASVYQARMGAVSMIPVLWVMMLAGVLIHEFGRRIFTGFVGGTHDEFMLWPAGGVVHPSYPYRPGAMFVSHIGGVVANLLVGIGCAAALYAGYGQVPPWWMLINPLLILTGSGGVVVVPSVPGLLWGLLACNIGVMWASMLPYYWFDGGHLLQSVLWPVAGHRRSVIITCIVGMALGVLMFFVSLSMTDLMGMILWGLLFASAFSRWKQARYESDFEGGGGVSWAGSLSEEPPRRRKSSRLVAWMIRRKAAKEQAEQAAVDQILEKVAQHGMHSLTSAEKKTLQRASERLREERRM